MRLPHRLQLRADVRDIRRTDGRRTPITALCPLGGGIIIDIDRGTILYCTKSYNMSNTVRYLTTSAANHNVHETSYVALLSGCLFTKMLQLPPDSLPGLCPWTPLGDFRPPDPILGPPNRGQFNLLDPPLSVLCVFSPSAYLHLPLCRCHRVFVSSCWFVPIFRIFCMALLKTVIKF